MPELLRKAMDVMTIICVCLVIAVPVARAKTVTLPFLVSLMASASGLAAILLLREPRTTGLALYITMTVVLAMAMNVMFHDSFTPRIVTFTVAYVGMTLCFASAAYLNHRPAMYAPLINGAVYVLARITFSIHDRRHGGKTAGSSRPGERTGPSRPVGKD